MSTRNQRLRTAIVGWVLVLAVAFLVAHRSEIVTLPASLIALLGPPASADSWSPVALVRALAGVILAALVVASWWGLGDLVLSLLPAPRAGDSASPSLAAAERLAIGAGAWSLVWLGLGAAHLYRRPVATVALVVGIGLAAVAGLRLSRPLTRPGPALPLFTLGLLVFALAMALVAALAPATGEDTRPFHLAVARALVEQGGGVSVAGPVASFYPVGVQIQSVWTLLLGGGGGSHIGEAAAHAALFAWAPLLLAIVYGWTRERGLDRRWALTAALAVASIPTVYHVVTHGSVDLALSAYVALVMRAAGRWWTTRDAAWLGRVALSLGWAFGLQLTAGFVVLPLVAVLLAGAWRERVCGPALTHALTTLSAAAFLASPWYVRNWLFTGSPVLPLAANVGGGHAPGWDAERARLYEVFLGLWGRSDRGWLDQLTSPIWLAISAQLESANDDGVLGVVMLLGLPLVAWAIWHGALDAETKLAALLSGVVFVSWLQASQQLRYLLPAVPAWTLAVVVAAGALGTWRRVEGLARASLVAAAALGLAVSLSWFAAEDPLRVVLGFEERHGYLARRLQADPSSVVRNETLPPDARVWRLNALFRDGTRILRGDPAFWPTSPATAGEAPSPNSR